MEQVPGVEEDPEERVTEAAVDDGLQRAARLADADGRVPLGDRLEVRRDEALHVVAHAVRELRRVGHDEARATRERSPDAERGRERVAPLDRAIAGTQEAQARARTRGEHEVARQRHPVPAEQLHALLLGQAWPQGPEEVLHALRRVAGGVLERDELLDLVDGPAGPWQGR